MYERRKTRQVKVGDVAVGGDAPISIQSMTTTKTDDVQATLIQVHELATQGADIVRVAVPHEGDAKALPMIAQEGGVPIIADIHFSVRLAMMAIEAGVHGLRLNPGNMRNPKHIKEVADAAREAQDPDPDRRERRLARQEARREVRATDRRGTRRERALRDRSARGARLHRHQGLGQASERLRDDRRLPVARRRRPTCRCTSA